VYPRFCIGFISLLLLLSLFLSPAAADSGDPPHLADRSTHESLSAIEALVRHGRYQEAEEALAALVPRVQDKPYDAALMEQTWGYLSINLKDYNGAIRHFHKALKSGLLPPTVNNQLRFMLIQLYARQERYKEAGALLGQWLEDNPKPSTDTLVLVARIVVELSEHKRAINYLQRAIGLASPPKEEWYQMLLGVYLKTERWNRASNLLKQMIRSFPRTTGYWKQLASVQLQAGQEREALVTLRLAHSRGILRAGEIIQLVRLGLYLGAPLEAAQTLQRALQNGRVANTANHWRLLADNWQMAREIPRSVAALEQAQKKSDNGRDSIRAGELLYEAGDMKGAIGKLNNGIDKGGLSDPGKSYLLLGMSYFEDDNPPEARAAFISARDTTEQENLRQQAVQWLEYMNYRD